LFQTAFQNSAKKERDCRLTGIFGRQQIMNYDFESDWELICKRRGDFLRPLAGADWDAYHNDVESITPKP